ncbi:MAG: hypothetical protein ACXWQQ_02055 [Pseudobdellovibrio sp.]
MSSDNSAENKIENQQLTLDLPYTIAEGKISRKQFDSENKKFTTVPLCNFCALVVKESRLIYPDRTDLFYEIEGQLDDGTCLPTLTVSCEEFESLNWVNKWGIAPNIYPSRTNREEIRAAIQQFSRYAPTEKIYGHIGWNSNEELVYITSSGALTARGINSDIKFDIEDQSLKDFHLPQAPVGVELVNALHASFSILDAADDIISIPTFAAVCLAPLAHVVTPSNFSMFFVGLTGSFKSSWAAVLQAFWGKRFSITNLPLSMTSTANYIEKMMSLCLSSLLVIDDYVPSEQGDYVLNRTIRNKGNGQGRARLRSDTSHRPPMVPRCLPVITAEDFPNINSIRARTVIVEFEKRLINQEALSKLQRAAQEGVFSQVMSSYIVWLIPKMEELKISAPDRIALFRTELNQRYWHSRTADTLAELLFGLEVFCSFAVDSVAMTDLEAVELFLRSKNIFRLLGDRQAELTLSDDPAKKFVECLSLAFFQYKAHLVKLFPSEVYPENPQSWGWKANRDGIWEPCGDKIGWLGNEIVLKPDAAYKVALAVSRSLNSPLNVTKETLWRALAQKGYIQKSEGGSRNLARRLTPEGNKDRYLVFTSTEIFQEVTPLNPETPEDVTTSNSNTRNLDNPKGVLQ